MTLRIPTKVLLHVWSYDFYDMTLSTGKQRRHMINSDIITKTRPCNIKRFFKFQLKFFSNEYPQSMFWSKNKKHNYVYRIPQFCYIKVGYKGVYVARICFPVVSVSSSP